MRHVHVFTGANPGFGFRRGVFRDNLPRAFEAASRHGLGVLIEPINPHDIPFYHLQGAEHVAEIVAPLGAPNLRMLPDGYHIGRMDRNMAAEIQALRDLAAHIQIAAVPGRAAPARGDMRTT